ncbi:MAG: acyl CoA:acetate/3-ketoacid CoA transferase [Clostridiales Family XIII bacterium]|jgi:propionate CoA-transferase|nr:acyl CoA:acetate/3-ketoacid CoA transferase [Clostridiales Family XIII bacterium]
MDVKFVNANEVPKIIKSDSTLAIGGFIGIGISEEIHSAMEDGYLKKGEPNNLTLLYVGGMGDKMERGLNHYAHRGLVKRAVGGHWGLAPKFQPLVEAGEIEGYNFPQGVVSQMFKDAAARRPFHVTTVGMGTFADPEIEGGKLNEQTTEDLVTRVQIEGVQLLAYKTIFPDYAIIKGSYADEKGNISFEEEPLTLEALSMALATHNNGGKVIVQVRGVKPFGTLKPKDVEIPAVCVDYVVVAKDEDKHRQTLATPFNDDFLTPGIVAAPNDEIHNLASEPLNIRKIIARRAAMCIVPGEDYVLNYGIGMPEGVPTVLAEEDIAEAFLPTLEPGVFGGTPQGGLDFGAAIHPESIIQQCDMFSFYNGGGIDAAVLGMAEMDSHGNVNVSKFGSKLAGAGGFIDISQAAKKVIFVGSFMTHGCCYDFTGEKLHILKDDGNPKLVKNVEQITFSAKGALAHNQKIYYVTERAVFTLTEKGVELLEVAPGIDLEKDVLNRMEFEPIIADSFDIMASSIFFNGSENGNRKG